MNFVVMQRDKNYAQKNILLRVFGACVITSMVFPLLLIDLACIFYHGVYFRLQKIPLIPRRNYIIIDRGRLHKLSWVQRWNCAYCDYANGLIAWIKAVINTTEVYSCAIKHGSGKYNQEYQKEYFAYEDFQ